ncbi:hypothetical protein I350_07343 [Cryptococcus amylolentus CBS 6273]|uniref:C3H1-type domain-containing protein n=1 Tax=Cryptococcus amylolentus CBS 6273 TaxID=1296118 RepID=A0A1E3JEB2_9TREE|nr:hypothetical protein I350_07343 [Cryptococcus amylolentus CBS 6273]
MAPTELERKKLQLQQEIARLSGAITRHSHSAAHPYHNTPSYAGRGGRGRGAARGRGRGRGRGASNSYSLDLRAINKGPTSTSTATVTGVREEGEILSEPAQSSSSNNWVATNRAGSRSLMTVGKRAQLHAESTKPMRNSSKKTRGRLHIQALPSLQAGGTPRVFVDKVSYEFNAGGKGLRRTSEYQIPNTLEWYIENGKTIKVLDVKYKFQPNGNLVPLRPALCPTFTKTGRCRKAHICRSIHDPNRVTACFNFLRGRCELGDVLCPLSHTPTAHNTPSCVRFQALSYCTRANCPFPHVKVAADAPICEDFAHVGWCDKEEGTCQDLHSWDCPEFWSTGKCSKGKKCRLRHTVRAELGRAQQAAAAAAVENVEKNKANGTKAEPGGFEEQTEFIEFDEGAPAMPQSDDDDSDDDSDDDESDGKQEVSADDSESDSDDDDVKIIF